jgi:hypothetical protein
VGGDILEISRFGELDFGSLSAERRIGRRGTTLIQLLVVISLIAVLSSLTVSTVISVLQTEANAVAAMVADNQFVRLANDWDEDVASARFVRLTRQIDQPVAILGYDQGEVHLVTYVAMTDRVVRHETDGKRLIRTETYRLPEWSVSFDSPKPDVVEQSLVTGQSVRLICHRPLSVQRVPKSLRSHRDEQVIAVVGRDHRHEKSEARHESN